MKTGKELPIQSFWQIEGDNFKSYDELTIDDIRIISQRITTGFKGLNKQLEDLVSIMEKMNIDWKMVDFSK
jgi:hypothetical protein